MSKIFFFSAMFTCAVITNVFANNGEVAFPEVQGFKIEENYPVYTPSDLWDYINGASDAYISYKFQDLHIAEYVNDALNIKVEIYHHQNPECAFGIYSMERSPDYHFVDLGSEGYQEGVIANFVNGPFYVKIMTTDEGPEAEKEVLEIARKISQAIDPKPKLPAMIKAFPQPGEQPKSAVFTADSFLGHEFLNDVYSASYDSNEQTFDMFVISRPDASGCQKILNEYFQYTGGSPKTLADGTYKIEDKYNGTIYFVLRDNLLIGFMGNMDEATMKDMAEQYKENLDL